MLCKFSPTYNQFTTPMARCMCASEKAEVRLSLLLNTEDLGLVLFFCYFPAFIDGSLCLVHCQHFSQAQRMQL